MNKVNKYPFFYANLIEMWPNNRYFFFYKIRRAIIAVRA